MCKKVYAQTTATKMVINDISFYQCALTQLHAQENSLAKDIVDTLHQVHGDLCTNDGSV